MAEFKPNEAFQHNPQIAEIDRQLEAIDQQRHALREQGRTLMAQKRDLILAEQIELMILNDQPLSGEEQEWTRQNPDKWNEIKKKTKGKRGSRRVAVAKTVL
jgi:hypothetical protein